VCGARDLALIETALAGQTSAHEELLQQYRTTVYVVLKKLPAVVAGLTVSV
jgi:hypothetical protein